VDIATTSDASRAAATLAALGAVAWSQFRIVTALRGTTLQTAWRWSAGAHAAWIGASAAELAPWFDEGVRDQLWYAACIVWLASAIAVLGSQRPGVRVWGAFILLPLCCVLGWPALLAWRNGWPPHSRPLGDAAVATAGLVALMGYGNFLGTRFGLTAAGWAAALTMTLLSVSSVQSGLLPSPSALREGATCVMGVSAVYGLWLARAPRPRSTRHRLDAVWQDFRDLFGMVWARRMQDRFNEAAAKGDWPFRLEYDGLRGTAADTPVQTNLELERQMEFLLRWLLRRFVDPPWIDRRLPPLVEENRAA
jgi:hypothetical protein